MNLSTAVMLVNKGIRSVKVEYDPDTYKNNSPFVRFKTIDQTLKVNDLVVVTTSTRHGFTVAKVTEVGFPVDFNSAEQWGWIVSKVDTEGHKARLELENKIIGKVGEVQENKMRNELKEAMGLGEVDFTDMDLMQTAKPEALAPPPAPAARYSPPPEDEIPF